MSIQENVLDDYRRYLLCESTYGGVNEKVNGLNIC